MLYTKYLTLLVKENNLEDDKILIYKKIIMLVNIFGLSIIVMRVMILVMRKYGIDHIRKLKYYQLVNGVLIIYRIELTMDNQEFIK